MLTCDTMDTAECVRQTLELVAVGCQIVRITAPTVKDAANLENIVAELRARGCQVPIVADIHFKPEAALEAAKWVEVVRINPGNYADSKKFAIKEYTDEQYAAELARIEEKFTPLVKLCKELGRAMRIGTNHGSLSDRIMNRFGDSPLGMVESALEFARIARKNDFHNFKFSMKSSNPKVMIECYRLLVARLEQEGPDWNYPIHLGVTEAGDGEDGRIKSAIGIGSLLCDGLGDTIRVSLTEDSPREIEVCHDLLAQIPALTAPLEPDSAFTTPWPFDPFSFSRRRTPEIELSENVKCGASQTVRVVVTRAIYDKVAPKLSPKADVKPEAIYEDLNVLEVDPAADFAVQLRDPTGHASRTASPCPPSRPSACWRPAAAPGREQPHSSERLPASLKRRRWSQRSLCCAPRSVIGSLLADGIGDAILVRGEAGAGPITAAGLQYSPGGGLPLFQDRLRRLSFLRPDLVQSANGDCAHQEPHRAPQRRQNRRHGLHRKRPRRNGGRRFRLRRRRAQQDQSLRRQNPHQIQYPRSRSGRPPGGSNQRARQMDRARARAGGRSGGRFRSVLRCGGKKMGAKRFFQKEKKLRENELSATLSRNFFCF